MSAARSRTAKWLDPGIAAALAASGTDACRIASAEGWRIDRFGDTALISQREDELELVTGLDDWCRQAGVPLKRIYRRRLVVGPDGEDAPLLIRGDADAHAGIVSENNLRYGVDFTTGYSCGFFPDQRANRWRLRELKAARVLNAFAYTCSFSVAAAAAGAATMSVDLARAALERGRRNLQLNEIPPEGHRFLADDVFAVLPRLARRGERFEAIVLDPPTFSRGRRGRVFRVERDFGELFELAVACAAPDAWILLSSNCSSLRTDAIRRMVKNCLRCSCHFFSTPPLPDVPATDAPAAVWVQV